MCEGWGGKTFETCKVALENRLSFLLVYVALPVPHFGLTGLT